ncbi:P-loop containing nucleoside triphosphate hydrolase protein [Epithele typhae]|uniref:P-loop containing nucleoside triphosphate hydrolase protein n=1 Tax=Epithele typhae TaxID=378194 RepID=UPI0020081D9B|nr:P-loop containing nucleoside triphosphate hydrolase protein [Epithele typhae]KAH9938975.1 P-loop containing nucleoside triphosphate hydrolase protein [Epithele typhae]
MAAPNIAPSLAPNPQFSGPSNNAAIQERMKSFMMRANALRSAGATPQTNEELAKIMRFLEGVQQQQRQRQGQAGLMHSNPVNGQSTPAPVPNGVPATNGNVLSAGPVPSQAYPPPSQTPVSFTTDQIQTLRMQIQAFKLISRGMPVPDHIQQGIRMPAQTVSDLQGMLHGADVNARVVDSAVKVHKSVNGAPVNGVIDSHAAIEPVATDSVKDEEIEMPVDPDKIPKGPFLEDDIKSGIYPYNAYLNPFSHLKRDPNVNPTLWATRMQRLLIPSIMPVGLDPHQMLEERNAYIDSRMEQRMRELEAMPAMMGDGSLDSMLLDDEKGKENADIHSLDQFMHPPADTHGKLRALIELKSLRVIDKQRALRASVAERLMHGSLLPLNRTDFRRTRKVQLRDIRLTEAAERKQRADRERRAKRKHIEQLEVICNHGKEVIAVGRSAQERITRLGRAVLSFHSHTEKEEQRRIERLAKERLKALKNDDEEAYMRLIDTAKDTRITHLLKQTDSFLDGLAQAVVEQQRAEGGGHTVDVTFESEEGPVSEETFGAKSFGMEEEKGKLDYYSVAHRIKEKVTQQPGILIGGTLKEYQVKGLQWMVSLYNNKLNGILADEMGLGKTIQTISLITFLIESKKQRGPYLVIVPLSTMTNWSGEFAKWAPSVRLISYKGNPTQRKFMQTDLRTGNFQVVLTTYEYIIKDRIHLSRMKWIYMIIVQAGADPHSILPLRYRLILTGTPLQNNLPELWALLNFALPKVFNSIELNEEEALLIIRRLHKVLRPFLLRRLKRDVESELPDKVEKIIKVRMSALQSQLYKQMKKYKMIADGKDAKGKNAGVKGLSNELMQLRKICQHPFLFESVEDKVNPSSMIDDKIIRSSGKIELLARVLPKFFMTDHRVLIFFQMTKVMDIMEDFLKMMGWKYLRLDGGTKTEDRAGHVKLFNAPNSEYKVFILSTRAGGLGLNLQTADTVVIFDSDWNPHADLQAQDRAHRIGQTKVVRILRFITEKSVEEAMFQRARYKLDIDDKVIQAGRFDNKSTQEEQEEFLRSILEADQEEENEEAGDMNDDEINEIIARSPEEAILYHEYDVQRSREQLEAWKRAGFRGKPPPPLMQLEELPECYRTDEPFTQENELDEVEGRGHRRRTVVNYSDGLSDDQWAMAVEDGEDIQELSERAREKKDRRAATKAVRETESNSPAPDFETPRGRKKKGKGKASELDVLTPASTKRKRGGGKSTTPLLEEDDDDRDSKRRKTKQDIPPPLKEKMKKALTEVHKAVVNCADETGRRRSDLFREPPDRREYPDYYHLIQHPIALSTIRKRVSSGYYKSVLDFREDMRLMFNNARTYNQEGSWVYVDADEMEKTLDAAFARLIEDERPAAPRSRSRKAIISDDEYMSNSDEE